MQTGRRRYGAGRTRRRDRCDDYLALDVRQLRARDRLRVGTTFSWHWSAAGHLLGAIRVSVESHGLTLSYQAGQAYVQHRVELTRTPCRFGGLRTWFACPDCGRRCAVVYGVNGNARFSCRLCMNLAYASEAEGAAERLWRRQIKLQARVGEDGGRPKWMRARTYWRICEMVEAVADARVAAFLRRDG